MTNYAFAHDVGSVTIASGTSLSGGVALGDQRLFGIVMPSSWTAANLTFQASVDGGQTWHNLRDKDGNEITAVVSAAGDGINLDYTQFTHWPMIKIRSGTAASAVNQGADRALTLILRSI